MARPPASSTPAFIYLASQSPRRQQLLQQLGVPCRLLLAGPEEDVESLEAQQAGELPAAYVQRVTRAKLRAARARLERRLEQAGAPATASNGATATASTATAAPILCADTTVALGRRILGKPQDAAEARASLQALSGRTHRVLTALGLWTGRRSLYALQISKVRVAPLPAAWIEAYIGSGEPFGKAGAYAIQGGMGAWVQQITGSHSGIMGLPLFETNQLLRLAGWPAP